MTAKQHHSVKAENDPRIFSDVRKFLEVLNSGGGKPIEQGSPVAARQVLEELQQAVSVDYSGIEESQRLITEGNSNVNIHVIKPLGAKDNIPVFMFFHGGGWVLGDYPTPSAICPRPGRRKRCRGRIPRTTLLHRRRNFPRRSTRLISPPNGSQGMAIEIGGKRQQAGCCGQQCRRKYGCRGCPDGKG